MFPTASDAERTALIPDLEIRQATAADRPALARLTARNLGSMIGGATDEAGALHLAAFAGAVPVGLLLSRRDPDDATRQEILSLMVTPLLRRQGVARALLESLACHPETRSLTALSVSWSERLPEADGFLGLLGSLGFAPPAPHRLRMSFNVCDALEALELARRPIEQASRQGLESLPLSAVGDKAPELLAEAAGRQRLEGRLPGWADPEPWFSRIDPAVSQLVFGADGTVRGWLLAEHQPALNRHAAPVGWSEDGAAAMLLAAREWLLALQRKDGPGATLVLQPTFRNGARLAALLDRHFRPHALWADQLVTSFRPLAAAASSDALRGSSI